MKLKFPKFPILPVFKPGARSEVARGRKIGAALKGLWEL